MSQQKLREAIDKMVEDAIRRVLPGIMNEVLLKTIANSGIMSERTFPKSQPIKPRRQPQRPATLNNLLDETAGADFYDEPLANTPADTARMALSPEIRHLAEGVNTDGEMWEDGEHDSGEVDSSPGPSLDRAVQLAGLDFSRMKHVTNVTESKKLKGHEDKVAEMKFDQARIKRMREQLNGGKPVE